MRCCARDSLRAVGSVPPVVPGPKPNRDSSELTSLLLEIPPAKLIRLLPLVETSEYQGRGPHPIVPWLCRLTRPRSSELNQLLLSRHLARLVRPAAPREVDGRWLSALRSVGSVPPVEQGPCRQTKFEIERVDLFATRDTSSKADLTAATRRDWQLPRPWAPSDRAVAVSADRAENEQV
jgi:hypothetical protein